MPEDCSEATIKATAQRITDDDARAVRMGVGCIPPDEVIAEPNPADFVAPHYLSRTAPALAGGFAELLVALRDMNAGFVGERTVEAQANLSLTGDHEELENRFLGWCQRYFTIRGSPDRLNPRNNNDPLVLFQQCFDEYTNLLEYRIIQPGTINSSVLNLSQRFMVHRFPVTMFEPELASYRKVRRDRFGSMEHRAEAARYYDWYTSRARLFESFLTQVAGSLPVVYRPDESLDWLERVRADVTRQAEDLNYLRYVLPSSCATNQEVIPGLWARFDWDVYHGGSIGTVLTSDSAEPDADRSTVHEVGVRRDGWLCHREYSWLRVDPDYKAEERHGEFAANRFILDTLTTPLYQAWVQIEQAPIVTRGLQSDATEAE